MSNEGMTAFRDFGSYLVVSHQPHDCDMRVDESNGLSAFLTTRYIAMLFELADKLGHVINCFSLYDNLFTVPKLDMKPRHLLCLQNIVLG